LTFIIKYLSLGPKTKKCLTKKNKIMRIKEKNVYAYQEKYESIEKALIEGAVMNISCSENEQIVVKVEKDGKLLGYGEYPTVNGALLHCENKLQKKKFIHEKHNKQNNQRFSSLWNKVDTYIYKNKKETLRVFFHEGIDFLCRKHSSSATYGYATTMVGAIKSCMNRLN